MKRNILIDDDEETYLRRLHQHQQRFTRLLCTVPVPTPSAFLALAAPPVPFYGISIVATNVVFHTYARGTLRPSAILAIHTGDGQLVRKGDQEYYETMFFLTLTGSIYHFVPSLGTTGLPSAEALSLLGRVLCSRAPSTVVDCPRVVEGARCQALREGGSRCRRAGVGTLRFRPYHLHRACAQHTRPDTHFQRVNELDRLPSGVRTIVETFLGLRGLCASLCTTRAQTRRATAAKCQVVLLTLCTMGPRTCLPPLPCWQRCRMCHRTKCELTATSLTVTYRQDKDTIVTNVAREHVDPRLSIVPDRICNQCLSLLEQP
jgi:hypothetical protein